MAFWLFLVSTLALAESPEPISLRSCGSAPQALTLYRTERTLGTLGLQLSDDVDEKTPVSVLSNTHLDETTARHMALDVASTLGYTVRPRRGVVRAPRNAELATEATALVLVEPPSAQQTRDVQLHRVNGRAIVVWPEAVDPARLLRVVAATAGIASGTASDSTVLPDAEWLASLRERRDQESSSEQKNDQAGDAFDAAVDPSRVQIWSGDTGSLCDLLADRLEPIFLLEEGSEVDLMISSVASISALDALDILSTIAPDIGVSVVEDGDIVLIQQADPPTGDFGAPLITLLPAGETLYGMTPEAFQRHAAQQPSSLNMRAVRTRSESVVMLVGEDGMFSHIPVPEVPARDRRVSLDKEGITRVGEGHVQVKRGTFADVDVLGELMPTIRVTPYSGEQGEMIGYRMSGIRRSSVFWKLGFLNGDILHSVNGVVLDSMSAAMTLAEDLQHADEVTVQLFRRNQLQTMTYEVVPADGAP